jgi:hypothetical protein
MSTIACGKPAMMRDGTRSEIFCSIPPRKRLAITTDLPDPAAPFGSTDDSAGQPRDFRAGPRIGGVLDQAGNVLPRSTVEALA